MKKTSHPHDQFLETFRLLQHEPRKFLYQLENRDFLPSEKKLLWAFYYFKKNKKHESLSLIKSNPLPETFLEGVRLYLVGLSYNQYGHYRYAVENLKKSIEYFHKVHEKEFIVNPLCLLSLVYANRRELDQMAPLVDDLKEMKHERVHQKLQVTHVEAVYLVLAEKHDKAQKIIHEAMGNYKNEVGVFKPFFLILLFSISFKTEKYKQCYQWLEEYKKCSGTLVKANYSYMKVLLDHLDHEAPLYIYASDYQDFPELHQQLEVIKALSLGDRNGAEKYWKMLQRHNGELYQNDFKYVGELNLFSKCLEVHQVSQKKMTLDLTQLEGLKSIGEKLHYIFKSSEAPLSSFELLSLIWKEEPNETNLARLRKQISLYEKKYQCEVLSRQMTYQLKKVAS